MTNTTNNGNGYHSNIGRYYANKVIRARALARYFDMAGASRYCEVFGGGAPAMLATYGDEIQRTIINDPYNTTFAYLLEESTNKEAFVSYCEDMRRDAVSKGCNIRYEQGNSWTRDYKVACEHLADAHGSRIPSRQALAWATKRVIEGAFGEIGMAKVKRLSSNNLESLPPAKFIKSYAEEGTLLYVDIPFGDKHRDLRDVITPLSEVSDKCQIIIRIYRGEVMRHFVEANKWFVKEITTSRSANFTIIANYKLPVFYV